MRSDGSAIRWMWGHKWAPKQQYLRLTQDATHILALVASNPDRANLAVVPGAQCRAIEFLGPVLVRPRGGAGGFVANQGRGPYLLPILPTAALQANIV